MSKISTVSQKEGREERKGKIREQNAKRKYKRTEKKRREEKSREKMRRREENRGEEKWQEKSKERRVKCEPIVSQSYNVILGKLLIIESSWHYLYPFSDQ